MAPPQGPMRPGRQLAALGTLFVVLYALVFFTGDGGWRDWREKLEPKLGLDLIGGTRVTLEARTESGGPPPGEQLERARQIIENRVNGLGVSEAEVVTEGNRNIVISLAGKSDDQLKEVGSAAQLRFRKVLAMTQDNPSLNPAPSGSASASGSASGSASATPSGSATPSATPSASTTPSGSASPSASGSAAPTGDIAQRREAVKQKIGAELWGAAESQTAPIDLSQAQGAAEALQPFAKLSAEEVAVLPASMQFNIPHITCQKLLDRPVGSIVNEKEQAVGCDKANKYLMDVAKVLGTDVGSADANLDQTQGGWVVSLKFKGNGQDKWTNLTREAVDNPEGKCQESALGDDKHCLVAVVLDNEVVSAPEIQQVITSDAQISGSFTSEDARLLASQLKYGALPLSFNVQEAQSVSATLGTDQLRAGLLAAGVGMLLVVVYAFFYYRLLGSVIFLSLVLSALLVFASLILLGRQIGFTLTLAGIAGFIVSLGVAADSFVIYFERLKDEIREGRSARSAVPRAWVRARRTIISANTITLLAAVVLYIFSIGSVQGFAFALGLATVLDLLVVFLFRHPIMTMFARTKAFLSPRVSGLGRVLRDSGEEPTVTRPKRVKEA